MFNTNSEGNLVGFHVEGGETFISRMNTPSFMAGM